MLKSAAGENAPPAGSSLTGRKEDECPIQVIGIPLPHAPTLNNLKPRQEEHGDPKKGGERATEARPILALSQVLCLKKSRETGPTRNF